MESRTDEIGRAWLRGRRPMCRGRRGPEIGRLALCMSISCSV